MFWALNCDNLDPLSSRESIYMTSFLSVRYIEIFYTVLEILGKASGYQLLNKSSNQSSISSRSKEQPRLWHMLTQFSISVFGENGGSSV